MYVHLWHVDGERGEVDREVILGPFEGVQLTYSQLRETGSGDTIAWYSKVALGARGWTASGVLDWYSDITFSDTRPESVVG